MLSASEVHGASSFDVVLSADNSVPHLLSDEQILLCFRELRRCVKPGGVLVLTVRDYETEDARDSGIRPYSVKEKEGERYMLYQVWFVSPPHYRVSLYCVRDFGAEACDAKVFHSEYYMVTIPRLLELALEAGFSEAARYDGEFYQPVIIAWA
jgi:SAM-dependent methyltransferase